MTFRTSRWRRTVAAIMTAAAVTTGMGLAVAPAQAAAHPVITVGFVSPSNLNQASVLLDVTGIERPTASHPGVYVLYGTKTRFPSQPGTGSWGRYISGQTDNRQHFLSFGSSPGSTGTLTQTGSTWQSGAFVLRTPTYFIAQDGSPVNCLVEQCGIIVIGAHGQASSQLENFLPITFAPGASHPLPGDTSPTATGLTITSVSQDDVTACDAPGSGGICAVYTVTGTASPANANSGQGFYLRYGWLDPSGWQPSTGALPSTRIGGAHTVWVHPAGSAGGVVNGMSQVGLNPTTGAFTATVVGHQVPGHPLSAGNYHFFTVPAHGVTGSAVSAWEVSH